MSFAAGVLDALRQVAVTAEGSPFAQQAVADAEHVAALIPEDAVTGEAERHVVAWLTRRLHPGAAFPAVPPAKPVPEPAPVQGGLTATGT